MGNVVELVFHSVATGNGLSKIYGEVKGLASAMPGLTKATVILGSAFGSVGAAFGRMASMFLSGGIWGVAAEGAKLLIEKLGLFKDRTEEARKQIDDLREATDRYHKSIVDGSNDALVKIDAETKILQDRLDITNRLIKAELELRRAQAIKTGDMAKVEGIDRQKAKIDSEASLQKSIIAENAASRRYSETQGTLSAARKNVASRQNEYDSTKEGIFLSNWKKLRQSTETALKDAFGPNARLDDSGLWNDFRKNFSFTTEAETPVGGNRAYSEYYRITDADKERIKYAKERLEVSQKELEDARAAAKAEMEKLKIARESRKVIEAEQKAADAAKSAAEAEDRRNKAVQVKKELAAHSSKSLNSASDAAWNDRYNKASDEQKIAMLKEVEDHEKAVMKAAEKDLETVTKPASVPAAHPKPEDVKDIISRSEKAQERMLAARNKRLELEQKIQENDEKDAKKKSIDALRKKADSTREQIQKEREYHEEVLRRLYEAREAVPPTIDVLGNAAGMDQAGDLRGKRQGDITDRRFTDRFTKLLKSSKIKQDANGNWMMDGRASNLDKAVLDRLNANEKVKRAEAEAAKQRQRLEKMEGYLKTISETIKTATEI